MEPGEEEEITQEKRQRAYDAKQTTDDHGMHAVGLYTDQNGTKYLLIKNSWGTTYNDCDGYFYASEAYFKYKTINIYSTQGRSFKRHEKEAGDQVSLLRFIRLFKVPKI